MQTELRGKSEWFPVSESRSFRSGREIQALSNSLTSSVGFCAKACKYKSHSRSRSSDYTDPLSSVLQYHHPTPGVMGEI